MRINILLVSSRPNMQAYGHLFTAGKSTLFRYIRNSWATVHLSMEGQGEYDAACVWEDFISTFSNRRIHGKCHPFHLVLLLWFGAQSPGQQRCYGLYGYSKKACTILFIRDTNSTQSLAVYCQSYASWCRMELPIRCCMPWGKINSAEP